VKSFEVGAALDAPKTSERRSADDETEFCTDGAGCGAGAGVFTNEFAAETEAGGGIVWKYINNV